MAVVSRNKDKSILENVKLLELVNGGADSVVELKKITQGAVIVKSVHLLINRGSLGHEEEALVATTVVKNLDSLEGHVLEAREVKSRFLAAHGVVLEVLEVVRVDVAVEPDGHGALAEDTESFLAGVEGVEGGLVGAYAVALVGKLLIVVLAQVGALAGVELLSTTAKEDVGTTVVGPAVVGNTVEGLVNERTVLATATSVAGQGNGGSIGNVGSGNGTPSTVLRRHVSERHAELWQMERLTQIRLKISTMVSTLGSSKASGEESA